MGRVVRQEVIAVRCELRSCGVVAVIAPLPVQTTPRHERQALLPLLEQGWGFVLTPQMRSYCGVHRERVWNCTCRTNPDRRHLCTVHSASAAQQVWLASAPELDERLAA